MKKRHSRRTRRESNRKNVRSRNLRFESLEPRYVLDGSVVINEIMYHPDTAPRSRRRLRVDRTLQPDVDQHGHLRLAPGRGDSIYVC